ncbi:MAG: peptidylprolyl isomerase [Geminicoccus sp.]|nr:peptidylprolyl isomerase [Geminicoccus sp.]
MAGSIAVALLSGLESIAKPSIGQIADQVVAAGGSADQTIMIDTKYGYVAINLRADLAPKHTMRLTELTREGFYDGIVFHRVIEGFMAQTGDPTGTGRGGSELPDVEAEFSDPEVASFVRGAVGMARSQDPNSANSQFFIMFDDGPFLDGQYTIVGEVLVGMDAVDQIKRGAPGSGTVTNPDRMRRVFMLADEI